MGKLNNKLKQFCVLPISLIRDTQLSDRARFVFCWMASMPRDWEFYLESMSKEIGYSVDTLRKYISELVNSGWIVKGDQINEGRFGAVAYTLNESKLPAPEDTDTEKTRHGKNPAQPNRDYIPNRDYRQNKDNSLYDFVEKDFAEPFMRFVDYRRKIGRPLKEVSLEASYNNLKKLADNNPAVASEIVEQSICNQWQGLFKLKNNTTQNVRTTESKFDYLKHTNKFTEEDAMYDDI